jgi:hypothetical protein
VHLPIPLRHISLTFAGVCNSFKGRNVGLIVCLVTTTVCQFLPSDFEYFFYYFGLRGYWHCGHSWHIVPASGDSEDDCGEADGM